MTAVHDNPHCFCCGTENPASFGLRIQPAGGCLIGTARLDRRHEGARGMVHGGALTALIDELLGELTSHLYRSAVTASLTVDFRAPVILPREIRLRGWCERVQGRKLFLRAEVFDGDALVAEARGLWIAVSDHIAHSEEAPTP